MNTNANVPNLQHDVEDALYRVSMLRSEERRVGKECRL